MGPHKEGLICGSIKAPSWKTHKQAKVRHMVDYPHLNINAWPAHASFI